jgi:MYXO-CTERM domain-containing protein
LNVTLLGGYLPLPRQRFDVVTHGSRRGEFDAATGLDDLAGYAGLDFLLSYEPGAVVLAATAMDGDANLDARVDVFDLAILANHYGGSDKSWLEADFTGDGHANVFDLAMLANNYGRTSSRGEPIPGPATLALLALGGLPLIRRKRRPPS